MTRHSIIALVPLLRRIVWVSLGCWILFVGERFAFNVFDVGAPYHVFPTMFLWLLVLPWIGYSVVFVRSSLLATWAQRIRIFVFCAVSLAMAMGFLYASVGIFWTIAKWKGVQWW